MISIVTAYTPGTIYEDIATENRARCKAFGYDFLAEQIRDSGDLHGDVPAARFKPGTVQRAWGACWQSQLIVWMDADAVLIRPIDDLVGKADLITTIRDREELGKTGRYDTDYLNSGVVSFANNKHGRCFLSQWALHVERGCGDQEALNRTFEASPLFFDWAACEGQFIRADGSTRIALPARTYNFWHWPATPPADCRGLHFKHGILAQHPRGWWRDKIAEALA